MDHSVQPGCFPKPTLGLSSHLCVTQTWVLPASSATGQPTATPMLRPSPPTHHQRAHQTGIRLQPREAQLCRGRGTQKDRLRSVGRALTGRSGEARDLIPSDSSPGLGEPWGVSSLLVSPGAPQPLPDPSPGPGMESPPEVKPFGRPCWRSHVTPPPAPSLRDREHDNQPRSALTMSAAGHWQGI